MPYAKIDELKIFYEDLAKARSYCFFTAFSAADCLRFRGRYFPFRDITDVCFRIFAVTVVQLVKALTGTAE